MAKRIEVELHRADDGMYEAHLPDGTKFETPNKADVATLAAWAGPNRPVWNKTSKQYEGTQNGELMTASTLQELKDKIAVLPDEDTYQILSNMPEYPTLYAPSKTKEFDKRLNVIPSYEDVNQAKRAARESDSNYVFELLIPKSLIKEIDRSKGVFKIKVSEVSNDSIKRAMRVNAMDYEPPNSKYHLKDYDGILNYEEHD